MISPDAQATPTAPPPAGMFRFVMKEHQDTYTVFYSELTGRTLKRRQGRCVCVCV